MMARTETQERIAAAKRRMGYARGWAADAEALLQSARNDERAPEHWLDDEGIDRQLRRAQVAALVSIAVALSADDPATPRPAARPRKRPTP